MQVIRNFKILNSISRDRIEFGASKSCRGRFALKWLEDLVGDLARTVRDLKDAVTRLWGG